MRGRKRERNQKQYSLVVEVKLLRSVAILPNAQCPMPVASCHPLPFWGANPFKFCLMSLNCAAAAASAAIAAAAAVAAARFVHQVTDAGSFGRSRFNLYKCPKLSKMSVQMSRAQLLWAAAKLIALCKASSFR